MESALAEWIFGVHESTKPAAKAFDSKRTQYECSPHKSGSETQLFLTLAFSLSVASFPNTGSTAYLKARALSGYSTRHVPELLLQANM